MKLVIIIGTAAMLFSAAVLAQAPKGAPAAPSTPAPKEAPAAPAPTKAAEPAATSSAAPPAAKPAEPAAAAKPASAKPKRSRANEDARECLKLATNRQIAVCAQKYL